VSTGGSSGGPFHSLATLNVPAGKYIIDGMTQAFTTGSAASKDLCFLSYSSLSTATNGIFVSVPGNGGSTAVPLHDAVMLSAATTIKFNCTDNSQTAEQSTVLRATLVDAIN
jgi:hypothetical protein